MLNGKEKLFCVDKEQVTWTDLLVSMQIIVDGRIIAVSINKIILLFD